MLVSLFAAALLAQTPPPRVPVKSQAPASLPLVIEVPAIPFSRAGTLHFAPSRKLIPLTATLTLDTQDEESQEEEDLVAAINNERTSRGLTALIPDALLNEAAQAHSREMSALSYFAHVSPTPGEETPADRYLGELQAFNEKPPSRALVGENIFYASVTNSTYNADYAHRRLMASPEHRDNILEPRFTKVGVGLYRDPQGQFWVTEMFLHDN